MRFIQNIIIITILISGSILAYIDQLVTTNIIPFIIACIITSAIFLMRPIVAIILYLSSFAVFYYLMGLAQQNEAILLSDRINGMTSIGIAFCVSMIMWATNSSNIMQRRLIQIQQRELKEKNIKLEALAFYDSLTGLYSRRKFEELIQNEISMILRYEHESCIVILDIDKFKEINDNYGHPVGDMVIKQIAYLLKKNVRETDSVARWGGDEFLILLPHTSIMEGEQVAEKLRKMIEEKDFLLRQHGLQITSSFGVAGIRCNKNDTLELAYKNVDKALYTAKEKGRNRVETA
jgi:diguanylate cyclase (GGDEF)-like protein